jgi:hypothetical protein
MASITPFTVDTSWRLSRIELHMRMDSPKVVLGWGETLVTLPGEDNRPLGTIPGGVTMRPTHNVMEETVEVDGEIISFSTALEAMKAFFERWHLEDEKNPPQPPPLPTR